MSDTHSSKDNPLKRFQWQSRVLVLFAADRSDSNLVRQQQLISETRDSAAERDLVIIEAIGSSSTAKALGKQLITPEGQFRAVLVGKDGGSKLLSDEPIEPSKLFAAIDAMPMRQQQMRVKGHETSPRDQAGNRSGQPRATTEAID